MNDEEENLAVVTVFGVDKPGIVAGITGVLASYNVNIVDISETVVRGLFTMIMIVDLRTSNVQLPFLKEKLEEKARELSVTVSTNHISVFKYMQRV
ncbi:MAG: ACT domain-containing protein [Thermoproteota archaeon]|nr:ACT domain-containing protein [Candidatus Brockarchaeota archaeon]MBO3802192.1 ACT domain-containing protein [Candidatus Brockarchaeota archaeon]